MCSWDENGQIIVGLELAKQHEYTKTLIGAGDLRFVKNVGFDVVENVRTPIKADRNWERLCQLSVWYWMLWVWSAVVMVVLAEHLYWCGLMGCITFCQSFPPPLPVHACTHTFPYARKSVCVLQSRDLSSLCCDRQAEAIYPHIYPASWMDMDL